MSETTAFPLPAGDEHLFSPDVTIISLSINEEALGQILRVFLEDDTPQRGSGMAAWESSTGPSYNSPTTRTTAPVSRARSSGAIVNAGVR